ncbi:MAG: exodeoxyribonuclease VII small subunit [Clostridia bacterium]|nr:exodeoxyribonuclease VII small subunit [Clostridia bacterium]
MATEKTFESSMKRLEEIVRLLEGGEIPLEDSIRLFEEGTGLVAFCSRSLQQAEQKIVKLTAVEAAEPSQPEET